MNLPVSSMDLPVLDSWRFYVHFQVSLSMSVHTRTHAHSSQLGFWEDRVDQFKEAQRSNDTQCLIHEHGTLSHSFRSFNNGVWFSHFC